MDIETLVNSTVDEIRNVSKKLFVAFSGGKDSTLVALLAKEALGKENVKLLNVTFGPYTYSKAIENVLNISKRLNIGLDFRSGRRMQEQVWKNGPSCNRCTKYAKYAALDDYKDRIIATGSNQSDSWGKTGIKIKDNLYSPIRSWTKNDIQKALDYFGFEVPRIGEGNIREGCKLKHLLKIMANPSFHGYAVSAANEVLLDHIDSMEREIANVKIIGSLSKNIALINVKPVPDISLREMISSRILSIDGIHIVKWIMQPVKLKVVANPALYRTEHSRKWVIDGRLKPEFAFQIKVEWIESKNNKLHTFQIVECLEENYHD
ncbi:MAG: phosphoadenosine phosphosulfate reductase family protein [Kosmotogaceae bacterium]